MENKYLGVNFNNVRKALYLMFFGYDNGKCETFTSPKYAYIIPMQGNFENPIHFNSKDTYIMYWIEEDKSLTQDDFVTTDSSGFNRQKCVASILVRFIGREAEDWVKTFRHLAKRKGVTDIWAGVCNAEKLQYTSPVIPRRLDYAGLNSQVGFDVRFKLYYDECISTGWQPLTGIDFTIEGNISVEGKITNGGQ